MASKRHISVELEIVSCNNMSEIDRVCAENGVKKVGDGSIRNDDGSSPDEAFELNTPPLQGDEFAAVVDAVCGTHNGEGAREQVDRIPRAR